MRHAGQLLGGARGQLVFVQRLDDASRKNGARLLKVGVGPSEVAEHIAAAADEGGLQRKGVQAAFEPAPEIAKFLALGPVLRFRKAGAVRLDSASCKWSAFQANSVSEVIATTPCPAPQPTADPPLSSPLWMSRRKLYCVM